MRTWREVRNFAWHRPRLRALADSAEMISCVSWFTTSGVTRGSSQGGKLSWKGFTCRCRGPTSQHSEKDWEW